jgi:hypothetical protein
MPFWIRPYRRFPVQRAVTYHAGQFQGRGTVWNLSCIGWRLSGDLPMRPDESLTLTVTLPNEQRIEIPDVVVERAGIWNSNGECPKQTKARLEQYIQRFLKELGCPVTNSVRS